MEKSKVDSLQKKLYDLFAEYNFEKKALEAVRDIAKEIQDRIDEGEKVVLIAKKHHTRLQREIKARLEELYWIKELLVGSSPTEAKE